MNKIINAAKFAACHHAGQVRKWTGTPYVMHPARVATRVILLPGSTEDMVCTAWLHDTIEDSDVTRLELQRLFGPVVGYWVDCLTNPFKGNNAPRAERKRMDREYLRDSPTPVKQIKLLDRIDNLSELPCNAETIDFCDLYADESEKLLECLSSASHELAGELREKIGDLRSQIAVGRIAMGQAAAVRVS